MEPRYYTPNKEDFHIGFQYQFAINPDDEWQDAVIKDGEQIDDIHNDEYLLRVKYLDEQDVVSEGWVKDKECFLYKNGLADFSYKRGDYSLSLIIPPSTIAIWAGADRIYGGQIKNVSELRFIMKRLGIK